MLITNPTRSPGLTRPLPCVRRLSRGWSAFPSIPGRHCSTSRAPPKSSPLPGCGRLVGPDDRPGRHHRGGCGGPDPHLREPPCAGDPLRGRGEGPQGVVAAMFDRVFQEFLKKAAGEASWSGSVCTGAFMIAAAGLLGRVPGDDSLQPFPDLKLLAERFKIEAARGLPARCAGPQEEAVHRWRRVVVGRPVPSPIPGFLARPRPRQPSSRSSTGRTLRSTPATRSRPPCLLEKTTDNQRRVSSSVSRRCIDCSER